MVKDERTGVLRLSEVSLERFKAAFKPGPIPLQPFNVVIGRNGSGKSTLLEALQWLDTTIRRDAREACDRYFGITDLINLRSQADPPYFGLRLTWRNGELAAPLRYTLRVEEKNGAPLIAGEELLSLTPGGRAKRRLVTTPKDQGGLRLVETDDGTLRFREPDRLSISFLSSAGGASPSFLADLADFWSRAVFLRLSPNRLAQGSLATRRSFEPLLDEEGQMLPALLNELSAEQKEELVENLRGVLQGIRGVKVSRAELGRDTRVHYSLLEQMPYRGRNGRREFQIPAWMLSEGTRRITALLALLVRDPPPSLLCIEEVENGLDPWTVRQVLNHLQSAADAGTQVILTTHSPWLLDHVPIDSILQVRRTGGDTRYERFAERPEIQAYESSIPAGTRYVQDAEAPEKGD